MQKEYITLTAFMLCVATNYILLKIMDEVTVEYTNGGSGSYTHPVFQALVCNMGQVFVLTIAWPVKIYLYGGSTWPDTAPLTLLLPALLDFADKILWMSALAQLSASLPVMIRGLNPIMGAGLTYLMFDKKFTTRHFFAMCLIVGGVALGCFVQLYYETEAGEFHSTWVAILLCLGSVVTTTSQTVIEQRIF